MHFGRQPASDLTLSEENYKLQTQKEKLQQELTLAKKEGETLRALLDKQSTSGAATPQLVAQLNQATRELATLRGDYAKLQAERQRSQTASRPGGELQSQLAMTEEKLASSLRNYTQLQEENSRLRSDVEKTRTENSALAGRVKGLTTENKEAQTALAQLNTELLAQKDSRARAEQDAEALRSQLSTANARVATLSATRATTAGNANTISPGLAINSEAAAREPNAKLEASVTRIRSTSGSSGGAGTPSAGEADTSNLVSQLAELRTKVASLENERGSLKQQLAIVTGSAGGTGSADASTPTDTQAKLATALRSFTLLQNENDQLKAESEKIAAEKSAIEAQLAVTRSAVPLAAQVQGLRDQLRQTQAQAAAIAAENANLKTRLALTGPTPASPPSRPSVPVINTDFTEPRDLSTTPSAPPAPGRVHTIAAGDSLAKISRQYYGTPNRWTEILAANRDILQDERSLVIGRTLRIP